MLSRSIGEFFSSYANWITALWLIMTADFLFTIMGLSVGYSEGNGFIMFMVRHEFFPFPLIAVAVLLTAQILIRRKWPGSVFLRILLWCWLPIHFLLGAFTWMKVFF